MTLTDRVIDLEKRMAKVEAALFPREENNSLMEKWFQAMKSGQLTKAREIRKRIDEGVKGYSRPIRKKRNSIKTERG